MASHMVLGFPMVQGMKLAIDEPLAVTIGGTVITELASLLVLAVCLPTHTSGFSISGFGLQICELLVYVLLVVVGCSVCQLEITECTVRGPAAPSARCSCHLRSDRLGYVYQRVSITGVARPLTRSPARRRLGGSYAPAG
jgi:hypothetical protein